MQILPSRTPLTCMFVSDRINTVTSWLQKIPWLWLLRSQLFTEMLRAGRWKETNPSESTAPCYNYARHTSGHGFPQTQGQRHRTELHVSAPTVRPPRAVPALASRPSRPAPHTEFLLHEFSTAASSVKRQMAQQTEYSYYFLSMISKAINRIINYWTYF